MVAVDISHPEVKELVRAGYSPTESILAIEKCGTHEKGIDYLIAQSGGSQPVSSDASGEAENDTTIQYGVELMDIYILCKYVKCI